MGLVRIKMTNIYLDQNWLILQDLTTIGALIIFFIVFLIVNRMYRQILREQEEIYKRLGWEWKRNKK